MRIDKNKLEIILARQEKSYSDLRESIRPEMLARIRNDPEYEIPTKAAGKLSRALGVDVTDILKNENIA